MGQCRGAPVLQLVKLPNQSRLLLCERLRSGATFAERKATLETRLH